MSNTILKSLLECDREELFSANLSVPADRALERLYGQALAAYLDGNLALLEKLEAELRQYAQASGSSESEEANVLALLVKLRICIRKLDRSADAKYGLEELLRNAPRDNPLLSGEMHFVAAMYCEVSEELASAQRHYATAYTQFTEAQAQKRAVKALHNSIAIHSRQDPQWNGRSEYFFLYRKAKAVGARGVAGTALYNISLEQERIGALIPALKSVQRAITLLHRDHGSLPFLLASAHHFHLLLQLGRKQEALSGLTLLKDASLPEAQAAFQFLRSIMEDIPFDTSLTQQLTPAWQRKLKTGAALSLPNKALSKLENQVVQALEAGPKDKFEMLSTLYGSAVETLSAENRFFNLLNRLKKKAPGLVYYQSGKYHLSSRHLSSESSAQKTKKKAG
jgi:hypothetical protein